MKGSDYKMNFKNIVITLSTALITSGMAITLLSLRTPVAEASVYYHPTPTPKKVWCHREIEDECHDAQFNYHCPIWWSEGKCEVIPNPTINPCQEPEEFKGEFFNPCITPEVTPVLEQPSNSGGPGDGRSDGGQSASSAVGTPECTVQFAAPILTGYKFNSDKTQTYSWWKSTDGGVSKQAIVYGYAPGQELFGADNLSPDSTSITISGIDPKKTSWLQVIAWKGECTARSNWFN